MNANAEAGPSKLPDTTASPPEVPRKKPPPKLERPFWWRFVGFDTTAEILSWRPGRKSAAFVLVAGAVAAGIAYDRSEAKRIRFDYEERVRHLSEEAIGMEELPRKVTVVSTRLPDDPTEDRAVTWFKLHVKPILNAAGIDYTVIHGTQPGALARQLVARFRERRLADLDKHPEIPAPGQLGYSRAMEESRELVDGGTVVVGRSALKEYLWALKKGYLTDMDLDRAQRVMAVGSSEEQVFEEDLGQELAEDGFFERALEEAGTTPSEETADSAFSAGIYSGVLARKPEESARPAPTGRILPALSHLPPQPPLLLIPFQHPLGTMMWWPKKAYHSLFNTRADARLGAEAALRLVNNHSRPIDPPKGALKAENGVYVDEVEESREWLNEKRKLRRELAELWRANATSSVDLDCGLHGELYLDKAFRKWPANIAQARAMYEKELKPRIVKAQEEGGAAESSLRSERLEKEARWRRNIEGWRITRAGSGVAWDRDAMEGSLRVFADKQASS